MTEPMDINWTTPEGNHDGGISTGIGYTIAWQRGASTEGGRNGAHIIEVVESCLSQMRYLNTSKFACKENAIAITHLEQALEAMKERRDRRRNEGTLGTTNP